ncbi:MAG: hypothetical protein LBK99_15050 [Opitutaceae bacterium]|jgi:hypothetical protein|nr:hypothetical protein [Opitutaceae bacterium]
MNPLKSALALAASCAALASSGHAALTITNDDIIDHSFTYTLTKTDMNTSAKFDADVFSTSGSGVTVRQEGTNPNNYTNTFIRANPDTAAKATTTFTYAFDFSGTGHVATNVTFTDSFRLDVGTVGKTTVISEYSTDGQNWTTITSLTSSGFATASASGKSFALEEVETVYYRVTFTGEAGFKGDYAQWNRNGPFTVTVALQAIPEPATATIAFAAAGAAAVVIGLGFRRLRLRPASKQ